MFRTYSVTMTVCIAAKADDGKSLVLAADQMATMYHITREAEGNHKIRKITDHIFVLIAGDGMWGNEIVKRVEASKDSIATVEECAQKVLESYIAQRLMLVEQQFLHTRGMTLAGFHQSQTALQPNIVGLIDQQIQTFSLDVSLLVAGIDPDEQARIYEVSTPGVTAEHGDMAAIGSGATHATNSLLAREYTKEMERKKAVYSVYEAKARSEVAPGVGPRTDMILVTATTYRDLSDTTIQGLNDAYKSIVQEEQEALEKISANLEIPENGEDQSTEYEGKEEENIEREAAITT